MSVQELLDQIKEKFDTLSASQRLVAAFVLENYNRIPFLTITELARAAGTSSNSVIKFCESLGYSKFTEFKALFSNYAHSELNMVQKIQEGQDYSHRSDAFAKEIQENSASVFNTLSNSHNCKVLPELIAKINRAKNIYVSGARSSALFAMQLASELRYLGLRVHIIPDNSYYLDTLSTVDSEDLIIAYSFPRYVTSTMDVLKIAHERGAATVVLTDAAMSPAVPFSDLYLTCAIKSSSYFLCLTGCVALTDLICNAVAAVRKEGAVKSARMIEDHLYSRGVLFEKNTPHKSSHTLI